MKDISLAIIVANSPVGQLSDNLNQMKHWVSAACRKNADMVCFPELNLTGYSTQPGMIRHALAADDQMVREMADIASENGITVMFGMMEKGPGGQYHASHLVIDPEGLLGVYRKLHIAPPEKTIFSPGQDIPLFDTSGCKFGIQLCYDAHFPELSSRMALNGAEILFIPHASPRGTSAEKYDSWMRHLTARAYDNSVYVVAWNQVGNNGKGLAFPGLSLVIGPSGKVMQKKIFDTEGMMRVQLKGRELERIRKNRMHYFLPHRREDLY